MSKTLGQVLKFGRKSKGLTLREIEEVTGLSNSYMSQLENDKIKKPSADVLYRLSVALSLNMEDILRAAGIIVTPKHVLSIKKYYKYYMITSPRNIDDVHYGSDDPHKKKSGYFSGFCLMDMAFYVLTRDEIMKGASADDINLFETESQADSFLSQHGEKIKSHQKPGDRIIRVEVFQ